MAGDLLQVYISRSARQIPETENLSPKSQVGEPQDTASRPANTLRVNLPERKLLQLGASLIPQPAATEAGALDAVTRLLRT